MGNSYSCTSLCVLHHTALETLQEIRNVLRILLRESNFHQQDLEAIRDDLGMLKFGFAQLQDAQYNISSEALQLKDGLKYVSYGLADLHTKVMRHRRQTNVQFRHLHRDLSATRFHLKREIDDVEDCLEDYKEDTEEEIDAILDFTRCGGHGWTEVINLDFEDSEDDMCPTELQERENDDIRTCGRPDAGTADTCTSFTLTVNKMYQRVCGMIIGHQFGAANGFQSSATDIDGAYLTGVSLTHGSTVRNHIWSFAVGHAAGERTNPQSCPCDAPGSGTLPPDFIGNEYFCESGVDRMLNDGNPPRFYDNRVWNGEGCRRFSTCCDFNAPPYFIKDLHAPTDDDIEVRICTIDPAAMEDVRIREIQVYVQ